MNRPFPHDPQAQQRDPQPEADDRRGRARANRDEPAYQFLLSVAPPIDRWLIPMTDGRWSSGGRDQIGMLTSTGAKSGAERSQPLV